MENKSNQIGVKNNLIFNTNNGKNIKWQINKPLLLVQFIHNVFSYHYVYSYKCTNNTCNSCIHFENNYCCYSKTAIC